MLYCPTCRKKVDFNSVAVSGPARAYTLDLDGPVDPTIIRSSSKVVNVCKNCGSQNLSQSEAAFSASQRYAASKKSSDDRKMKIIWLIGLIGGLICGPALAMNLSSGEDPAVGFLVGFVGGFVVISIVAAAISDLIEKL
jgi:hypothetical protein